MNIFKTVTVTLSLETNTVEPPNTTTTDSADLDHFSPRKFFLTLFKNDS